MKKALLIGAVGLAASLALAGNAQAATPDVVRDLECSVGSELGSIWFVWTVPTDTDDGYEFKYNQGNTLSYDTAYTYSQSWASGTPETKRQELVRGLNPNTEYSFGMKAKNLDLSMSPVSNHVVCTAAGVGKSSVDSLPPSTVITSPAINSTLQAGMPITIKGNSKDNGSSSVQKVELSFDNGYGWSQAKIVSNDSGNLIWEYKWNNPSAGSAKVLIRSYDWLNNIETPIELPLTLTSSIESSGYPTTTTATTTTTTTSNPVTDKEAMIATIQKQLIALIQQLIAILIAGR